MYAYKTSIKVLSVALIWGGLVNSWGELDLGRVDLIPDRQAAKMPSLEKELFNLKFAAKNLERVAKKCEKEEKKENIKLKTAIQKGNIEGARIHAENSIRQRNQLVNFLRMSSRIDAVAQRVQTAAMMKQVTKGLAGVVKSMDSALRSMDLEKVNALLDKFEKQFGDLDVQSAQREDVISGATILTVPTDQVDRLI
ncbi:CHMP1B [Branchiostoma lanceolatum]|uniref:CHMP1B protein n=1 Tax=Branchiostoma lanceolatum TaxID=7740 RepID=A0A8J9Z3C4_BRALA|nr:CHMP1B [Branchiostoma lanceolatum]